MNNSPLITTAALASIVSAAIALIVAFGVHLTPEQQTALMGFITVLAPWIVALVGHNTTTTLSNPTTKDGESLVRASGDPTPANQEGVITRGIKIPIDPPSSKPPTLGNMG